MNLSPDFPPRERTNPILQGQRRADPIARELGMNQRPSGASERDEESGELGWRRRPEASMGPNQHEIPMPQLEILVFDGLSPRWWIRSASGCLNGMG